MVYNYEPENSVVSELRKKLGRFSFEKEETIDGLQVIYEHTNDKNEKYYGFM